VIRTDEVGEPQYKPAASSVPGRSSATRSAPRWSGSWRPVCRWHVDGPKFGR